MPYEINKKIQNMSLFINFPIWTAKSFRPLSYWESDNSSRGGNLIQVALAH